MEAYNLELFAPKQINYEVKEKLKVIENTSEKTSKRMVFQFVVLAGVVLATVFMLIYNQVAITEAANKITGLNKELAALQSDQTRIEMQIENKMSIKKIEEYATEQLGLVKLENYQIKYVDITKEDKIEIASPKLDNDLQKGFLSVFQKFKEYIAGN